MSEKSEKTELQIAIEVFWKRLTKINSDEHKSRVIADLRRIANSNGEITGIAIADSPVDERPQDENAEPVYPHPPLPPPAPDASASPVRDVLLEKINNIADALGEVRGALESRPANAPQPIQASTPLWPWLAASCCMLMTVVGIGCLALMIIQVSRRNDFENKTAAFLAPDGGLEQFNNAAGDLKSLANDLKGKDSPKEKLTKAANELDSASKALTTAKSNLEQTNGSLTKLKNTFDTSTKQIDDVPKSIDKKLGAIDMAVAAKVPQMLNNIEAFVTSKYDELTKVQSRLKEMEEKLEATPMTRILIGDTAHRNYDYLRSSLTELHHRLESRSKDLPSYDVKILIPLSTSIGQQYDPNKQYFKPSENASVDWGRLEVSSVFGPDGGAKGRCIIVCDGMAYPPQKSDANWERIGQVDVLITPPGDVPLEKTRVKEWQSFAKERHGTAIVVSLLDTVQTPANKEQGKQVAAVLRGILDGPLTKPAISN
jgi:hypothetical protein